jgi:hypothetical protein
MKMRIVLFIFIIATILSGCSEESQITAQSTSMDNTVATTKDTSTVNENQEAFQTKELKQGNKNSSVFISTSDVEYITMQGGVHIHTKALFPGHDDEKISKIIALVNAGTGKTLSTDTEINVINSMARPVGIHFELKDGSKIYAWPDYTTKSFEDGWFATTLDDRFILQIQEDGLYKYYTIFSEDVAKYLKCGWNDDMPIVKEFEVKSGSDSGENKVVLRSGDKVIVSGDGCVEKEVIIRIMRSGNPNEVYDVGRVTPQFGQWEWEEIISSQCKTLDGETVTLANDLYDIMIHSDGNDMGVSEVIDLRNFR